MGFRASIEENKFWTNSSSCIYDSVWKESYVFSRTGSHLKIVALKYDIDASKVPLSKSFLDVLHLLRDKFEKVNLKTGIKVDFKLLMR